MGKKSDDYYHKYRLTNTKTGEVFEARGLKNVLLAAELSETTPQQQLRKSKKWSIEVVDIPQIWDEATYRKQLYAETKDRYKSYEQAKLLRDPLYERRKKARLRGWKNKDGSCFTAEQHEAMLKCSCKVCGATDDIVVDHCHTSLVVRGSLCRRCNLALGFVDDSVEILDNLKNYLNENGVINEQDKSS